MSTIFYIGTEYKGTTANAAFDDVLLDEDAVVTWELYDRFKNELGNGTATYVSDGVFTVIVDPSYFESQKPLIPTGSLPGRLIVRFFRGGVEGSLGNDIKFMYPPLVQS